MNNDAILSSLHCPTKKWVGARGFEPLTFPSPIGTPVPDCIRPSQANPMIRSINRGERI